VGVQVAKSARWAVLAATSMLFVCMCGPARADTTVSARLHAINNSGVSGTATLTATNDGRLTVVIHASGLVPGQPHAQHIHGSVSGGHFMCPSMANDADGDGLLTNEEATGEYGVIYLSLTTRGDSSPASGLSTDRMPVADASGHVDYRRTFSAAEVPDSLLEHLSAVHVVQHGIDVNNNNRYDVAGAGVSTFAQNLGLGGVPEEATDPASCGVVTGAMSPVPPHGGVETGGQPGGGVNGGLAALGASLLAMSAAALFTRRPGRVAPDGRRS
jgi:hypothetical protein